MCYKIYIMNLALFDLDNTLIDGDSDYEWGSFLVENNFVDPDYYQRKNDAFFEQYKKKFSESIKGVVFRSALKKNGSALHGFLDIVRGSF